MSRGLDAATITALSSDNFDLATLVYMGFSTPVRITDWGRDVSDGSDTFLTSGAFLNLSDIAETSELRVNEVALSLSGVDQEFISIMMQQPFLNQELKIWRVVLSNEAVVGSPILAFDGLMTGCKIVEDMPDSKVEISVASHWKNFDRVAGRSTNDGSQKRFYPSDNGLSLASDTEREIFWGRK